MKWPLLIWLGLICFIGYTLFQRRPRWYRYMGRYVWFEHNNMWLWVLLGMCVMFVLLMLFWNPQ